MLTVLGVDRVVRHSEDRFNDHAVRLHAADIGPVLILHGESGFQPDPAGEVVVVIQPELITSVIVVAVPNHAVLIRIGRRDVVAGILASARDRQGVLLLEAVFEHGFAPISVRKEQHPPQAGVQWMRDGIRVAGAHPVEQVRGVHRGGAGVNVRLVIHDRHLIVIGRLHHAR